MLTRLEGEHISFKAAQYKAQQDFFFFIDGLLAAVDEFCCIRPRDSDIKTSVGRVVSGTSKGINNGTGKFTIWSLNTTNRTQVANTADIEVEKLFF